jgi:hypothetical protein
MLSLKKRRIFEMADCKRPNRRRLTVDVPEEIFFKIKDLSVHRNCTLTKCVIRALIKELKKEEKFRGVDRE